MISRGLYSYRQGYALSQWSKYVGSRGTAEWVCDKFVFSPEYQRNEINLCLDNTDSDMKVHALHYANELLVCVRLSFQKLLQTHLICGNNTKKNVWEKSNDVYPLSIRVQTTINHISICFFYHNINVKENVFTRASIGKRSWTRSFSVASHKICWSPIF